MRALGLAQAAYNLDNMGYLGGEDEQQALRMRMDHEAALECIAAKFVKNHDSVVAAEQSAKEAIAILHNKISKEMIFDQCQQDLIIQFENSILEQIRVISNKGVIFQVFLSFMCEVPTVIKIFILVTIVTCGAILVRKLLEL